MSQKKFLPVVALLAVLAIFAAAALAYAYLRPTAAASAPIAAVPLTALTNTPEAPGQVVSESTTALRPTATQAEGMADAPAPTATTAPTAQTGASGAQVFEIIPDRSEARFIIDEILNGSPKTVIGATNQVSGQIEVDPQNPAASRVGVIQVNARTLTTDNEFRNRAIKNRILMTDANEFVTFTPTALTGLPASVALNLPFTFQISGDLTVKGVTRPVTFDAQVTPISETEIQGLASTTVQYADFDITVPNVPAVTGLDEEVKIEIEFVAAKK